jgi:hypothetical protein
MNDLLAFAVLIIMLFVPTLTASAPGTFSSEA